MTISPTSPGSAPTGPIFASDSTSKPDVSLIVVSYNVAPLLEQCLESVLDRPADGFEVEIIVVDNASADGSAALVRQKFPSVQLVQNEFNYGFPRGCNQALRRARGRFLFFLNPDATLAPGTLAALLDFMVAQPQAGIVGPMVCFPDGTLQPNRRRFPGRALAFVESTPLERYRPFKNLTALKNFKFGDVPPDRTHEVDWLVGAAFVVRREVVEDIGGLDERFFMYSEELDFCRRARLRGWQVWYVPTATVTHQEGQSSRQDVPARHINFQTSKLAYYRKYDGSLFAGLLRRYLLGTYLFQYAEEWLKLRLGHKPALRRERLGLIAKVVWQGLRPYRSTLPRPTADLDLALLTAEFYPQPGGVGDYTARLAQALHEARVGSVRILTETRERTSETGIGTGERVKLEVVPLGKAQTETDSQNKNKPASFGWFSLPALARHLDLRRADVLNIQYQTGAYEMHPAVNFLPLYLKWKLGPHRPRVVTTFHDLLGPYLFPKAGPLRVGVNRLLMRSSDFAVVTNEADYAQARAWGMPPDRLHLVPIGANIEPGAGFTTAQKREEYRAGLGLAPADFAVGYFGLTNRSKGLDTLLQAFAQLRQNEPQTGWKLVIVGGETGQTDLTNREYARELADLSVRLGLEGDIIRTGHLPPEETSRTLTALDAVALPFQDGASFRRGSLLAPLAHGLPVVTTHPPAGPKAGSGPQLIDGQNVLLVEPARPAALARALQQLRHDPALRARLSEGALILTRHFAWSSIAAHLLKIFQD